MYLLSVYMLKKQTVLLFKFIAANTQRACYKYNQVTRFVLY